MPSNWDEDEKAALISFLLEQKHTGKMGNGAFKAATMNAAAAHITQVLPNARGGQKNAQNGDEGYQPVAHQVRRPLGQCNQGNNYYGGQETGLHGLVEGTTWEFYA
ncbi:hypothetical protein SCLCIDRAFT_32447 [Scleroderma citrinum Foug A]|uniref:Myb/SANT-like domain-containing protein n=1 Tax=Scleroderma citrinum Foug A TaxID=1036808 RepID=A0A0C3CVW1_9AGAM|nr:hypothetical protein SCLCIDRAFT_32447 [Scleroderma citrinum Foug A]